MNDRDEEMLKFEKATNATILELKNWVLRKFRIGRHAVAGYTDHDNSQVEPNSGIGYKRINLSAEKSLSPTSNREL